MASIVLHGATIRCDQGTTPASLTVLPTNRTLGEDKPAATTMDHLPTANIPPFGMCRSLMNPQVAAATSAAGGALTPQPCIPVTMAPWTPGEATVTVGSLTLLVEGSTCKCSWAGTISITVPGSTRVSGG